MTISTSFPGIYLSEESSVNFSVTSSATALPIFMFEKRDGEYAPSATSLYLNDWAEFYTLIGRDDSGSHYFDSLKFWFMSGGGPCYMVRREYIIEEAAKYDDATLVVEAGAVLSAETAEKQQMYADFLTLQQQMPHLFGVFDGLQSDISTAESVDDVMKYYPSTPYAAAFYPWQKVDWSSAAVPPSVVAAVTIARTDRTRGVWKAPANIVISGITPMFSVSDELQAKYYRGKALNMIRSFGKAGTVVWGSRTLEDSDNWRYIPVRRLFSTAEHDIKKSLNALIFEPNSSFTWLRVKAALNNYLYGLWKKGALAGSKEEEAWFVEVGKDSTMTDADISQGKLIVRIGMAAVRPAEFIILQFSQDIAR